MGRNIFLFKISVFTPPFLFRVDDYIVLKFC